MNRTSLRTGCLIAASVAGPALAAEPDTTTPFINQKLAETWKAHQLTPAERASDEEFLRRVTLDVIGRIATPSEVRAFLSDKSADKRAKVVDRMLSGKLGNDPYANHWANLWTNWLLPRTTPLLYRQQLHLWLEEAMSSEDLGAGGNIRPKPPISYKEMVEKLLAASDKSNTNGAVNYLIAHRGTTFQVNQRAEDGMFDMVPATTRSLRLFLGYRLVAQQLPDHPVHPDFKPEQFWGVDAFFRQVEVQGALPAPNVAPPLVANAVLTLQDNPALNTRGIVSFLDKDGTRRTAEPVFLDGRKLPAGKKDRREVLAGFVTSHENFARAHVNRVWGHFFGRGLHERSVVDDFGSHHKIVHPELLDRLAKDFAANGYDTKKLIRSICASDAYQLKTTSNPSNIKDDAEVYFSRMPLKIMKPEQLLESLIVAIEPQGGREGTRQALSIIEGHISRRIGDADWDDLPAQDRIIHNVVLINRKEINDFILLSKSNTVTRAAALKDPEKVLEELYLSALNRSPTEKERTQIKALVEKEAKDAKDLTNLWQDVFWALLNSSEFILNH